MKFLTSVTKERVREVLHYDPKTGVFTWRVRSGKKSWSSRYAGKRAGFITKPTVKTPLSYFTICIDNKNYFAHRLAWLYMTGKWPTGPIDHKDHCGLNNKWQNLREATFSENVHYSRTSRSNNTSGFKGVQFQPHNKPNPWRAVIQVKGKILRLGYFKTKELAAQAYREASLEYLGEFSSAAAAFAVAEVGT